MALLLLHLRYALDFPMLDQWEFVPTLQAWHEGRLGVADLMAQHNEHRPALPRALQLLLAMLTGWDVRAESTLTLLCAATGFLVLLRALKPTIANLGKHPQALASFTLSALYFSAVQWQNWLLGWQVQLVLSTTLAIATYSLLLHTTWRCFIAALLLAIGATFSFANGLLVWPIGLVLLLGNPARSRSLGLKASALWTLAFAAVAMIYFRGYHPPPQHAAEESWSVDSAAYLFAYLGAPLFPYAPVGAAVVGGVLLWVILWVFAAPGTTERPETHALLPAHDPYAPLPGLSRLLERGSGLWLALALHGLGSAALTAWARQDQGGMAQALSSRYSTIALLVTIALLGEGLRQCHERGAARACMALCTALLALTLPASAYGAYRWSEHSNAYVSARPALLELRNGHELHYLHPDTKVVLERAAWLKSRGWSIYR